MKIFFLILCSLILSFCATPPETSSPEPKLPRSRVPPGIFARTTPAALPEAPPSIHDAPETIITPEEEDAIAEGAYFEAMPELPDFIEPPIHIVGEGIIPREAMAEFLLWHNTEVDEDFVYTLSTYYIEEAIMEGINHDVAFAQMCLETGFLRYGGLVTADMNNFCGLGAIGPEEPGLHFPNPRTGVRAHIQHLKAYASVEPLNLALVDPRYHLVRLGSSPTIYGLAGTWAADRSYSEKIDRILERLYRFSSQW